MKIYLIKYLPVYIPNYAPDGESYMLAHSTHSGSEKPTPAVYASSLVTPLDKNELGFLPELLILEARVEFHSFESGMLWTRIIDNSIVILIDTARATARGFPRAVVVLVYDA